MPDVILRAFRPEDRSAYITLYEDAFPLFERKPFDYMTASPAAYRYELLTVSTPRTSVAGLVILAYANVRGVNYVLLDYLAITPDLRGCGIGHKLLPLIRDHCHARGARLFLEIEAPDDSADNALQRVRRKAFYLSCGLRESHVNAVMYDTVMELLAYPEDLDELTIQVYQDVVKSCYPTEMGLPRPL